MVQDGKDLEGRLCTLSAHFNLPERAYALLHQAAGKGVLPGIEEQFAIMQKKNTGKKVTYSVQLLIDYLAKGTSFYESPRTILGSNYGASGDIPSGPSNYLGQGNRRIYPLIH